HPRGGGELQLLLVGEAEEDPLRRTAGRVQERQLERVLLLGRNEPDPARAVKPEIGDAQRRLLPGPAAVQDNPPRRLERDRPPRPAPPPPLPGTIPPAGSSLTGPACIFGGFRRSRRSATSSGTREVTSTFQAPAASFVAAKIILD